MDQRATVLLVSKTPIHLVGLITILREAGLDNLLSAESVEAAVELAKNKNPGLVVFHATDSSECFRAIEELQQELPQALMLTVSYHPNHQFANKLQKRGVHGCMCLSASKEQLLATVDGVLSGRRVYLVFAGDSLRNVTLGSIDEGQLSERELQVLTMIGEGKTNRDISQTLKISISSLETYRDRIKRKLGIDNARDLMRYAVQRQLEH